LVGGSHRPHSAADNRESTEYVGFFVIFVNIERGDLPVQAADTAQEDKT